MMNGTNKTTLPYLSTSFPVAAVVLLWHLALTFITQLPGGKALYNIQILYQGSFMH